MTFSAPKLATIVDDFRNLQLDTLTWIGTGTTNVFPTDVATALRGVQLSNSSIRSYNNVGGRRADFWDSEIVWIVGSWSVGATDTLAILNTSNNYGYRFEYLNGTLLVKSIEGGVTYTGANFLDGTGATVNWGQRLRYMRIAHNAATGKVEFYAGESLDGSDQRIMTSDLGTGAKGTLTPAQSDIDDMVITMSAGSGGTSAFGIRAVNAPAGGLQKSPEDASAYYVRDFNTWTGYQSFRFEQTVGTMSHEYAVMASHVGGGGGIFINDVSLTQRVMHLLGDGGGTGAGRTAIRTGLPSGIKDVNIEFTFTPLQMNTTDGYFGVFWRNMGGQYLNTTSANRYQLNITPTALKVDVFINDASWTSYYNAGTPLTLYSVPLVTSLGVTYDYKINHYEDRITVVRDGVEVMRFTDILGHLKDPGHIGFDVGNFTANNLPNSYHALHRVKVTTAYDDQTFASGIAMENRGLGVFVKTGRRDGAQVTSSADPSLVSGMEEEMGLKFKTAYHYTDITAGVTPLTAPVDTQVILGAQQLAREGRANVICINAFRPAVGQITSGVGGSGIHASYKSALDVWSAALNSIPGTVYAMLLPFPDINVPWSPNGFTHALTVTSSSTTSVTTAQAWTVNALTGKTIRFQDSAGVNYWARITSNTSTVISFVSVGATPLVGQACWVNNSSGSQLNTPAQYIDAYRAMVTYLREIGCRANFVFSMNWAPDSWTKHNSLTAQAYDGYFAAFYPGNDYVDTFLIRSINVGVQSMNPGYGPTMWRPLGKMLGGDAALALDSTFPPAIGTTPYYKMNAAAPEKKMLLLTGCAETHSRFNDLSMGFLTNDSITPTFDENNDEFIPTFPAINATFWSPATIAQFNPKSTPLIQPGIKVVGTGTSNAYISYTSLPTALNRISASYYMRLETVGGTNRAAQVLGFYSGSTILASIRLNQTTGQFFLNSQQVSAIGNGILVATCTANSWYRLDLDLDITTGYVSVNIVKITSSNNDRPTAAAAGSLIITSGATGVTPDRVSYGPILSNLANTIQGAFEMQEPKLSFDTSASTYSKAKWMRDALEQRDFPQITSMIIMSGDSNYDLPTPSTNNLYPMYTAMATVDTRLDASLYTESEIKSGISNPNPDRVHTAPQLRQIGYSSTASVGNLEYMYLKETGHVPVYLAPRIGGILLRDFSLGQASVRSSQEDRPNSDGIRDYSKYVGAKGVSLNFVTFDDPSGSAAFYADVISSWANPRRRPQLVYKMKDGEERFINLRPDATDSSWTTDGVRSGFKEVALSFVGIDGKDYSTEVNQVLMRQATMTQITTNGTAATPAKIRVYGGTTGCTNPTIVLQSLEQVEGDAAARISLGAINSTVCVPINQFIEIDMNERTVQLNGIPGQGSSYLKYLSDRQWFYLETYYNTLYLETDDGNGYAAVLFHDAYL